MARGRKPKPKALRILHHDFRPDRHNADQPEPEVNIPKRPTFLRGEAKKEYERITQLLAAQKCITDWDMAAITAYCHEWGVYSMLCRKISKFEHYTVSSAEGTKMLNPLIVARNKSLKSLLSIAVEFGLTPSSRAKLKPQDKAELNPFAKLMAGKTA
jgi:P27 family predicted phage terminase small subunit